MKISRRDFMQKSGAVATALSLPYVTSNAVAARPHETLGIGVLLITYVPWLTTGLASLF